MYHEGFLYDIFHEASTEISNDNEKEKLESKRRARELLSWMNANKCPDHSFNYVEFLHQLTKREQSRLISWYNMKMVHICKDEAIEYLYQMHFC